MGSAEIANDGDRIEETILLGEWTPSVQSPNLVFPGAQGVA